MIDLRTLVPLDVATILASVAKTSRLFTVEENPRLCGWGAEIVSIVADEGFYSLDAPIVRITTPHVPLPSAPVARGRGAPDASTGSSTRSAAGSRTRSDRRATAPDRRRSSGPGGWARRWRARWRAPAAPLVAPQPDAATGREALAAELGARVAATPGRGRRGGGRRRSRCSPTTTRSREVYGGAGRAARGRPRRARSSST